MYGGAVILRAVFILAVLSCLAARAGTYVQFRTIWGDMDVELYDEDKPITVGNFLRYVESGAYQSTFFHRCPTNPISGLTDFVVQGGGYTMMNCPLNPVISPIATFPAISNEFGAGRIFSNTYGTLAMAKVGGNTNSATSQWFFNLANNSFLDAPNSNGYFTVFGRVIRGTNVLNQYRGRSVNNGIQNLGGAFDTLPVIYGGPGSPDCRELEYLAISLLEVKVQIQKGAYDISWNSLNTNRYRVEFTTNLPPVWQLLISTNGIGNLGQTMRVTDPTTNAPRRFYRVRLDF
jgi:cyclophilin family peptidyl-prolyl cis-trans isomerase